MDRVIENLLGPYDLIETEVVVPLFQGVECDVAIVLAQRMRCRIHIHCLLILF